VTPVLPKLLTTNLSVVDPHRELNNIIGGRGQVSIEQLYGVADPGRNICDDPDLRMRNHSPESQRDLPLVNPLERFGRDEYHFLRLIILRLGSASVCDAVHGKNGQDFTTRKWLHVHTLNPAMAPKAGSGMGDLALKD